MGLSLVGTYICVVSSKIPASGKTDNLEHEIRVLAASTTIFHKIINGDHNDK